MRRILGIVLAVLREIFDEAAYGRFLQRQSVVSSREAYGQFLRDSEQARVRRPRCC